MMSCLKVVETMNKIEIIDYLKAKLLSLDGIEIGSQYTKGKIDVLTEVLKVLEDNGGVNGKVSNRKTT